MRILEMTVTRKVTLGFAAALGVMGAVAVISYLSTRRLVEDIELVAHTYRVMGEVRDILNLANRMNSSVRGYVITGKDDFLEPFWQAQRERTEEIKEVRDLIRDKPEQQRRLDAIEKLLSQQISYANNLISIHREKGFEAAERVISTGEGRKRLQLITEMANEMLKYEEELLSQRKRVQEASVWVANSLIILGGVLAMAIIGFAGVVLRQDTRERERLERAILEIGDRKQQQMGRDLHDSVCQELAGIAFMGQALERRLMSRLPEEAAEVARMTSLISKATDHARSIARGLQPVEVESNGLMVALEEMARNTSDIFHVECVFVCEEEVLVGDNAEAVHLYRIVQEAVHNAIRHGHASKVTIRMRAMQRCGMLEVRDNGKGIPDTLPERKGMGIETMRYRAEVIGGILEFRRAPGRGTQVRCTFKLPPEKASSRTKVLNAV